MNRALLVIAVLAGGSGCGSGRVRAALGPTLDQHGNVGIQAGVELGMGFADYGDDESGPDIAVLAGAAAGRVDNGGTVSGYAEVDVGSAPWRGSRLGLVLGSRALVARYLESPHFGIGGSIAIPYVLSRDSDFAKSVGARGECDYLDDGDAFSVRCGLKLLFELTIEGHRGVGSGGDGCMLLIFCR